MRQLNVPNSRLLAAVFICLVCTSASGFSQEAPYDVYPEAEPPYYRVRYSASQTEKLIFPVNFTIWIPEGVAHLRGIVVHQHGCGEGSCSSGLTGAYDLHWQALAKKHDCALLSPAYEQPQAANCQMWCDPRNGSGAALDQALVELGTMSQHPELASVPMALWGHSGGGHWCGGMVMTQPERIAAAWLRSGVPLLKANKDRPDIKPHELPDAALKVPIMCNPGTKEGVTETTGRFARVWPANVDFFTEVRGSDGLIGVAIDPLTAHECGNSRYLAIPWLDRCLELRLPASSGGKLRDMPVKDSWLAEPKSKLAVPANQFRGDALTAAWLPDAKLAKSWMEFRQDTKVSDTTPPPSPTRVELIGNRLRWTADADLESGIEKFSILRNGKPLAEVSGGKNRYGRQLFQNLLYSDTPKQPLVQMEYTDESANSGVKYSYTVATINTAGLKSEPTSAVSADSPN